VIPNIAHNAQWEPAARTIAGGHDPGSATDKLYCPQGLCVSRNQTILIADSLNHRIMKYKRGAKSGRIIAGKNINGYRDGRLSRPSNVICDMESKHFIICDYSNRRVLRWSHRSSTYEKIIRENIRCRGLAIDDEGSLYVSDTENHEVRRYREGDSIGTIVAGGHGQGARLCQLNHPTYIFVGRDQSVYVSDSWNDRVMKWEKDAKEGVVVAGGKGIGNELTQLNCPAGVIIDQFGTVYVADHWNHRVMRWYNGALFGDIIAGGRCLPENSEKQLNGPEGLAFDSAGNLFVADSYNHRIQRYAIQPN
jgi:sugar lactone lactonase YvrE